MLRAFRSVSTLFRLRRAHLEPPRRDPAHALDYPDTVTTWNANAGPHAERIMAEIICPAGSGHLLGDRDRDKTVCGSDQTERTADVPSPGVCPRNMQALPVLAQLQKLDLARGDFPGIDAA